MISSTCFLSIFFDKSNRLIFIQVNGILRNDGRNLYITIPIELNKELWISGGPLQYQYRPVEIYIRLAPPSLSDQSIHGSEHQIDNRSFDGEVRIFLFFFVKRKTQVDLIFIHSSRLDSISGVQH